MRRASPGRAARIVIALMFGPLCPVFPLLGRGNRQEKQRQRAAVDLPIVGAMLAA